MYRSAERVKPWKRTRKAEAIGSASRETHLIAKRFRGRNSSGCFGSHDSTTAATHVPLYSCAPYRLKADLSSTFSVPYSVKALNNVLIPALRHSCCRTSCLQFGECGRKKKCYHSSKSYAADFDQKDGTKLLRKKSIAMHGFFVHAQLFMQSHLLFSALFERLSEKQRPEDKRSNALDGSERGVKKMKRFYAALSGVHDIRRSPFVAVTR